MKNIIIRFKNLIHRVLRLLNISISKKLSPFLNIFGYEIIFGNTPNLTGEAAFSELIKIYNKYPYLNHSKLLDVGMGDGRLFKWLKEKKIDVIYEGLDLAKSADFKNLTIDNILIHKTAFCEFKSQYKFDVIFLSHFIEHQNNLGKSLLKLSEVVSKFGFVIFEWPLPHRRVIGGHMNYLTPVLLAYNLAKIGFNLKESKGSFHGKYATLVFRNIKFNPISNLIYDTGEIDQISCYLPDFIQEGSDAWCEWNTFNN